ncbi:MAG: LptF/LptG family permease [Synergistaceae bacterium]|nr:LptF/LptG family permease [Synergistaceae bacterium]
MQFKLRLTTRLILDAVSGPFFFGILIFTLIFVAGDLLFQAARLIIERGVAFGVVLRLFFYRLPEVMILTLPMSSLLAALLGMSTLAGGSELIALKSLGVPFKRILRPIIFASLIVSIAAISLNETLVPMTSVAADRLMRYEIMKNQASAVQEKVFLKTEEKGALKRVLYIDHMDTSQGVMSGVIIHEFENDRMVRTLTAQKGVWQKESKDAPGQWWIEDGRLYDVKEDGQVNLLLKFSRQILALNLSPEQLQRSTRKPADMSAHELWAYIKQADAVGANGRNLSRLWVMFHLKLAVPWACVIMAVLGAGFGAVQKGRGRSGSGVGFGISVVIVFAYYVVMSMCRALGESGALPALLAGWMPNLIFFAVALFFALRVDKI